MIAPKFGLAAVPHSVRRKQVEPLARAGHAAAAGVGDRHDAVDVVEAVEQPGLLGRLGDMPRDRRRTVHAGENADIVAHAGASVLAAIAAEGAGLLVAPPEVGHLGIGALFRHHQIVHVHMRAGRDRLRGDADHLAVFPHRVSRRDRRDGDFMAGGNRLARGDIAGERSAGGQPADRDERHCRPDAAGSRFCRA